MVVVVKVSSITSNYDMARADEKETKRMKYQVEEKWLALKEEEQKDRRAL
jgi:hypothetical protein